MATITKDTPVDDVVRNRAALITLARKVFEREEQSAIRAFSQFTRNADLANLIEAKRLKKFDYGICIREVGDAIKAPPAQTVLSVLDRVMGGEEVSEDDLAALGVEDSEAPKLLMTEKGSVARRKEASSTPQPSEEEIEIDTEKGVDETPSDETPPDNRDESGSDDGKFDYKTLNYLLALQLDTQQAIRGLAGLLESVLLRQETLAQRQEEAVRLISGNFDAAYLEEDFEVPLSKLPPVNAEAIEDLREGLFALQEQEASDNEAASAAVDRRDTVAASMNGSESFRTPTSTNGVHQRSFTETELRDMDRDDLNRLAESLGLEAPERFKYVGAIVQNLRRLGVAITK